MVSRAETFKFSRSFKVDFSHVCFWRTVGEFADRLLYVILVREMCHRKQTSANVPSLGYLFPALRSVAEQGRFHG